MQPGPGLATSPSEKKQTKKANKKADEKLYNWC